MKKHKSYLRISLIYVFVLSLFLVSCNEERLHYYDTPTWLKGSIYKVLQDSGDFSIFLKGVDIANMKPMLDGKSILTVMAPTDSAFTAYLDKYYGGKTIEQLPKAEVAKLIGFHILYYSFNKSKLVNFRPTDGDGATVEQQNINAGLYYKFRTKSKDSITIEKDTAGNYVHVYHLERFLPVFSYRMFQTKQINAKSNYEYFFPNTKWTGGNTGFNVANASVTKYAIIADNGYIYTIDRVLRPLETIYKELSSNPDFSEYLKLYNKYQYYQADANLTLQYGNGDSLYQHYHEAPLPSIACEWPVTDYRMVTALSYDAYSVFAPTNEALNSFFKDYWGVGGYDSLSQVSPTSLNYLLFNTVYSSSIVFPEEITKGLIVNSYGTKINFDVNAVPQSNRIICENGAFYGLDKVTPPAYFGSVTGPAFQYKKYSYMLDWISKSDLVNTLASDQTTYFMLYPSDDLMNAYGITSDGNGNYKIGSNTISNGTKQNYVYAHVVSLDGVTGSYTSLPTTGTHVLRTLSPTISYWYLKDGKITNNVKFDELLIPGTTEDQIYSSVQELTFRGNSWTNGKCYSYENTNYPYVFEGNNSNSMYPNFIPMMIGNRNEASAVYYGFIQLLNKAGLVSTQSLSILPVVEPCLMFIPRTSAVKTGILNGKVPGIQTSSTDTSDVNFFANCTVTNQDTLQYYLKQYFIPLSTATISNYPYVGWEESSTNLLPTLQSYDVDLGGGKAATKTTKISVLDANNKLSIRAMDNDGNPIDNWIDVDGDYNYFPFVYDDGCIQFINSVL